MKLQAAIDTADCGNIMKIVDQIADVADIIEVGTPMVIQEGVTAVRMIKEKYPQLTVLADTKIVDGGRIECQYAVDAGADIITVLALADDATIKAVTETAHAAGRKVMADLLCVQEIGARAVSLRNLGVDYIAVHTGVDAQAQGRTPYTDLKELVQAVPPEICAVAGGVNLDTIEKYAALRPAIIIAGGALCNAPDSREAAIRMKEKLPTETNPGTQRA